MNLQAESGKRRGLLAGGIAVTLKKRRYAVPQSLKRGRQTGAPPVEVERARYRRRALEG